MTGLEELIQKQIKTVQEKQKEYKAAASELRFLVSLQKGIKDVCDPIHKK